MPSEEAKKKSLLMKHFRPFFEEAPSLDLFALYGTLSKKQATKTILDAYKNQLEELWQSCLTESELAMDTADIDKVRNSLEEVITKALPFCLEEYDSNEDSFSLEVEVQKEVHHEVEVEILALSECYDPNLVEEPQMAWPSSDVLNYQSPFASAYSQLKTVTLSLNELCAKFNEDPSTIFSERVHASKNFAQVYQGQTQAVGVFLKPVFLIWYHKASEGLHATIITPQEAKDLESHIKDIPGNWIATTQDTVVSGHKPSGILATSEYQSLREQVRFFNGEFNTLLNQETPLLWCKENPVEKIEFFTDQLLPYKPKCASGLHQLKSALTQGKTEGFAYVSAHPFDDLTEVNWQSIFPKTISTQATEYKKLAEAFVYINKNWYSKELSIESLQQQFNLPLNSLSYIDGHLSHIMALKSLLPRLQKFVPSQPFLHQIPEQERLCLEQCLGITIERLLENSTLAKSPGKESTLTIASINALGLLRLYPAFESHQELFNTYFESCALYADSKELLLALLNVQPQSTKLLKNILGNTWADAETITHILSQRTAIAREILLSLAARCDRTEHLDLLLQQTHCDDTIISKLLIKPFVKPNHLIKMLSVITDDSSINNIGLHEAADNRVQTEILRNQFLSAMNLLTLLKHRQFSSEELKQALSHPKAITTEVLSAMVEQFNCTSSTFKDIVSHELVDDNVIVKIIDSPSFSSETADQIMRRTPFPVQLLTQLTKKILSHLQSAPTQWEPSLIHLLQKIENEQQIAVAASLIEQSKNQISTDLGLNLLAHLNSSLVNHLPLDRIIVKANEEQLDLLLQKVTRFPTNILPLLGKYVTASGHINLLLNSDYITAELAEILLHKPEYNGYLGNWDWLKENQVISILNHPPLDFESLKRAITHLNLTAETRTLWFNQVTELHKKHKLNADPKNLEQKLRNTLEELKLKAFSHTIKSLSNLKYNEAASTAFSLYKTLLEKTNQYFKDPDAHPNFKRECEQEIHAAQPVLAIHKGFKQILLDIINVVFALVGLIKNRDWRLFKANTDSINIVEEISRNLDMPPKP
jgi:hypothetical protein